MTSNLDPPLCTPPDYDANDPTERLTVCMQQLHRLVSDRIMGTLQSELQDEDVSFTQMTALYKVRAFAPISLTLLSEHLGVSLPATSQLIQGLVHRELMERRENPENRREKLLALSDKGQQFLNIREKTMMGAYREVFGQVNPEKISRAEQAITALILEAQHLRAESAAQALQAQPIPPKENP